MFLCPSQLQGLVLASPHTSAVISQKNNAKISTDASATSSLAFWGDTTRGRPPGWRAPLVQYWRFNCSALRSPDFMYSQAPPETRTSSMPTTSRSLHHRWAEIAGEEDPRSSATLAINPQGRAAVLAAPARRPGGSQHSPASQHATNRKRARPNLLAPASARYQLMRLFPSMSLL